MTFSSDLVLKAPFIYIYISFIYLLGIPQPTIFKGYGII